MKASLRELFDEPETHFSELAAYRDAPKDITADWEKAFLNGWRTKR